MVDSVGDKGGIKADTSQSEVLSTSKLAAMLGVESRELFALLLEKGWLKREGEHWQLTAKGEFQGGHYRQSEKYGQYVVWPKKMIDHPTLARFQDERRFSATRLAGESGLSGKQINSLLHELNWLKKHDAGWQPTALGRQLGAEQKTSKQGLYVLWPGEIRQHPLFIKSLEALAPARYQASPCTAMDGHSMANSDYAIIDNWLYLSGLAHAVGRPLSVQGGEEILSDFYLPAYHLYLEFWGDQRSSQAMLVKMEKKACYEKHQLALIELDKSDLDNIDKVLTERLLQHGVVI
ncbi:hypothetical protein EDC56_1390 [Sinobacterium caligoides]|uniref:Glycerol kinase n=1 Tax=Sinobacterium caligoides TaxID=933926 RepID=A0A3N2DMD6_9GAMM|nr:hypothetical protein [Sinobacterium caligoides]ROS00967.1 hypothetical protein EDC56_1390 [Sinobacterium caligoides]